MEQDIMIDTRQKMSKVMQTIEVYQKDRRKMVVHGGTHLGVVGCFGVKEFPRMYTNELKKLLMKSYMKGQLPVNCKDKNVR